MDKQANFSQLTQLAIQAALKAGDLLRQGVAATYQISSKEGKQNFVTEYDKKAEELIIDHIRSVYPDHSFMAEESGRVGPKEGPVHWIIDPLDGTTNFIHQIPLFAVSIAAVINYEIVTGVVYLPMLNELFVAEKGLGAFLNQAKIQVSKTKNIKDAVLVTGLPYDIPKCSPSLLQHFNQFITLGMSIRELGSAAIDLCYVAAGRFDAYWMPMQNPWDWAAGKLLVEEAGGSISKYSGDFHDVFEPASVIATNGHLHQTFIDYLTP